jgi:hypothetical protein
MTRAGWRERIFVRFEPLMVIFPEFADVRCGPFFVAKSVIPRPA